MLYFVINKLPSLLVEATLIMPYFIISTPNGLVIYSHL